MDATRTGTGVDDESLLFRKHEALPEAMVNISRPREHMAAMCTEQCRFKVSCKLCIDGEWPAPICDRWAVSVRDDIYYKKFNGSSSAHAQRVNSRLYTIPYVVSKIVGDQELLSLVSKNTKRAPMMWPDEFEFVSKTLATLNPTNYLEWGSGKSTSWYPLFAAHTYVIENYPPWCKKVQGYPIVKKLIATGRMTFRCLEPKRKDGSDLQTKKLGIPGTALDVEALDVYVHEVSLLGVERFDAVLVDGRFRVACALRLLEYLGEGSILIMHDFWFRAVEGFTARAYRNGPKLPGYNIVLKYYDCIGRTRSIAILKKKKTLPADWREIYKSYMNNPV